MRLLLLCVYLMLFAALSSRAQSVDELKKSADKFFKEQNYKEASPLYLRLVSLDPKDAEINYKYGVCVVSYSAKKTDAIIHFQRAVKDQNTPVEAYYYLGLALQYNYQFGDAITAYENYIAKRLKEDPLLDAKRQIEMCKNGKKLMTTISDLAVEDRKEITADKFFRIYELNDIGGNLLVTAEFQSKLDKKKNHTPLIHFPENSNFIYYSSYGDDEGTGKDIYIRRRLPDGSWGLPQLLPGAVNTNYDEDYPYMHPDGKYLYFSSKGHSSMGGYDVFRSKYNPETNSFGIPENMDFAISSPEDDLFYMVDSLNKNAYFASSRNSVDGNLNVFKVMVERVPLQLVVIKGKFSSDINPENKRIDFSVKDYASGEFIGKFNTNDKGVYIITCPKGGKYEFTMEVEGSNKVFSTIVNLPFLKEFRPLKQKAVHTTENDQEVVKLIDLFNEEVEDAQAIIAQIVRKKSDLNVNIHEIDLVELNKAKENKSALKELGLDNLMLVEIVDVLNKQVKTVEDNLLLVKNIDNNINNQLIENANEYTQFEKEIKDKIAKANAAGTSQEKYTLLREAELLSNKQQIIAENSKNLISLSDSIKQVVAKSYQNKNKNELKNITEQITQLFNENKEVEALELITKQKEIIKNSIADKSINMVQNLVEEIVKLDEEIDNLKTKETQFHNEIVSLRNEISLLEEKLSNASKKELASIESKIASQKENLKLNEEEVAILKKQISVKSNQKFQFEEQLAVMQDAISNKSIVQATREDAENSLKQLNRSKAKTLNDYLTQEISSLESKNPELKGNVVLNRPKSAKSIAETHQSNELGIQNDGNLSSEERLLREISNDRAAIKEINERLSALEKEGTSIDQNKEKNELLDLKAKIEQALKKKEAQVAENALQAANKNLFTEESVINTVASNYFKDRENIEKSKVKDKDTPLLALEEKLQFSLETEFLKVEKLLIKAPNDQQLLNKKEVLQVAMKKSKARIQQLSKADPLADQMRKQIDPNYASQLAAIEQNTSLSEAEKQRLKNIEEQKLLAKVIEKRNALEKQLEKDPTNNKLKTDIQTLEGMESQMVENNLAVISENNIAEMHEVKSEVNPGLNYQQLEKNRVIRKIDPSFANKIQTIENNPNLSNEEKKEKLIQGLELMKSQLTTRENELSNQGTLSFEESAELSSLTEGIGILNKGLSPLTKVESTFATNKAIKSVDPAFASKIETLKNYPNMDEATKRTKINYGLNKMKKQLENKEYFLKQITHPTTSQLEELKEVQEGLFLLSDELVNYNATSGTIASNDLIQSIDPTFASKIQKIGSNPNLSEVDRNLQMSAALVAMKDELKKREIQLENLPNLNAAQIEELANIKEGLDIVDRELQKVNKNQLTSINAQNQELGATYESNASIQKINPNFAQEIQAITANVKLAEEDRNADLNEAYQKMIQQLETRKSDLLEEGDLDVDQKRELADLDLAIQLLHKEIQDLKTGEQDLVAKQADPTKSNQQNNPTNPVNPTNGSEAANAKEKAESISSNAAIKRIDPSFNETIEAIENNPKLSHQERENQIEAAYTGMKSKLEAKEKQLNAVQNKSQAQQQELQSVQNGISMLNALLPDENSSTRENTTLAQSNESNAAIQKIDPNFNQSIANIDQDRKLTDQEKIDLKDKIYNKTKTQLERNENTLSRKKNPSAAELEELTEVKKGIEWIEQEQKEMHQEVLLVENQNLNATKEEMVTPSFESKVDQIDPGYAAAVESIQNDATLSQEAKSKKMVVRNEKAIKTIQKSAQKLDQKKTKTPEEEAQIQELNRMEESLIAENSELKQYLAAQQKNSQKASNKEVAAMSKKLIPDYTKKSISQLTNEEIFREIVEMGKVIYTVEQALLPYQEKTALTKKEDEERLVIQTLIDELYATKKELEDAYTSLTEAEIIAQANAIILDENEDYLNAYRSIANDPNLSYDAKKERLAIWNEKWIARIENEAQIAKEIRAHLKEFYEKNPSASLVQDSTEQAFVTLGSEERNRIINSIDPSYLTDVQTIQANQAIGFSEVLNKLQMEDQLLLNQIYDLLDAKNIALLSDPNNERLKADIEYLEVLQKELEYEIKERESEILENKESATSQDALADLVETLVPNYHENKRALATNFSMPEKQRVNEENRLDGELVNALQALHEEIERDPTKADSNPSPDQLEEMKTKLEQAIQQRNASLTPLNPINQTLPKDEQEWKNEVDPTYAQQLKDLEKSNLPKGEKLDETIQIERDLLHLTQQKLNAIDKQVAQDPTNTNALRAQSAGRALIQKQTQRIEQLEAEKDQLAVEDPIVANNNATNENNNTQGNNTAANNANNKVTNENNNTQGNNTTANTNNANNKATNENNNTAGNNTSTNANNANNKATNENNNAVGNNTAENNTNNKATNGNNNAVGNNTTANTNNKNNKATNGNNNTQGNNTTANTNNAKNKATNTYLDQIRKEEGVSTSEMFNPNLTEVNDLKKQQAQLVRYEQKLAQEEKEWSGAVLKNPNDQQSNQRLTAVQAEQAKVQSTLKTVEKELQNKHNLAIFEKETTYTSFDDTEWKTLKEKENFLEEQRKTEKDKGKIASIEKAYQQAKNDRVVRENQLLTASVQSNALNNKAIKSNLTNTSKTKNEEVDLLLQHQAQETKKADELTALAPKIKSVDEKHEVLTQALEASAVANELLTEAQYEAQKEKIEQDYQLKSLDSKAYLETKRRKYLVQIGALETEIIQLEEQLKTAKKKERSALEKELKAKNQLLVGYTEQAALVDQKLAKLTWKETPLKQEEAVGSVSKSQTTKVLTSKGYQSYYEKHKELASLQAERIAQEQQLNEKKNELRNFLKSNSTADQQKKSTQVDQLAKEIKNLEEEQELLAKTNTDLVLQINQQQAENMELTKVFNKLLQEGKKPLIGAMAVASLNTIPVTGFEINTAKPNYTIVNNVAYPKGLVYRVQVGAFSKELPEGRFSEFDPVTGEKLPNGITRYIAGYFNSAQNVLKAKNQIRDLGYTDAFPVAYCDGKRISMQEAKRLESLGLCLPLDRNELMIQASKNTLEAAEIEGNLMSTHPNVLPSISKEVAVVELDDTLRKVKSTYQAAPGAAPAEATEDHLGLFFTVQIGVYNAPVSHDVLFHLSPLMTLKLPNNQIRYSTGMFNSIQEALPKKREAVEAGVSDAFITAYYQGKRISLDEAKILLAEKGNAILEANQVNIYEAEEKTVAKTSFKTAPEGVVKPGSKPVQLISTATFEEFPRDQLNRYNAAGHFYYDESDKHIKSAIYPDAEYLPQVYYFRREIDTLYFDADDLKEDRVHKVVLTSTQFPGDVADWLYRVNCRKEIRKNDMSYEIWFFDLSEEKEVQLRKQIEQFGLTLQLETKKE